MQNTKLSKTYIVVLVAAIILSFIVGDKFATLQMYREQLAQVSLIELANASVLDDTAEIINTADNAVANEQSGAQATDNNNKTNATATAPVAQSAKALINLNTAGKGELITLPGIGEVKAQAIIDYREKYGSFYSTEEIMNVNGIGEKTYAQLKDLICI